MSRSPHSEERFSNLLPKNYGITHTSTGGSTNTTSSRQGSISSQRDVVPRNAPALPPLATLTGEFEHNREQGLSGSPSQRRPFGVRNILNPTSDVQQTSVPSASYSPRGGPTSGQYISHAPTSASPHVRKRHGPHSPVVDTQSYQGRRADRRILTPRSPRAASLGRSPSVGPGTINRIPLGHGERGYTAEPGEGGDASIPPLPPMPTSHGAPGGVQAREFMSPGMRGAGGNVPYSPARSVPKQQETHQEPARPPYMSSEPSPSSFPPSQAPMPHPSTGSAGGNQSGYLPPTPGPVRSGIQYGQPEYQLTIETQQGPVVVPVNVDYTQASRLADEKRKRNAGASARFRARRKEKEREANQTIAGLQQEIQEMMDEREFYRSERNFFRDFLLRSNHGPLPVRPPSPKNRRPHVGPPPVPSAASDTGSSIDYSRPQGEPSAAQRRRTGEYQPSLTSQSPGTPYNHAFPPPGPSMTLPTPPGPNTYPDARTGLPGPPPSAMRHPPSFETMRRNMHDREWTSGR